MSDGLPNPLADRRVWEGLLHAGPQDNLLISTNWGTEELNLEAFLHRRVRITIEPLSEEDCPDGHEGHKIDSSGR